MEFHPSMGDAPISAANKYVVKKAHIFRVEPKILWQGGLSANHKIVLPGLEYMLQEVVPDVIRVTLHVMS